MAGPERRVVVESRREINGKITNETRFYYRAPRTMAILLLDIPPLWRDARFHC